MADRQPNGEEKLLNFVFKVYDPITKTYRPAYIPPDATNEIQGDVLLSDAVDSALDAATGMTAASPKAIKTVQDNANNKLDKIATSPQTVKSPVTFEGKVTGNNGFVGDLAGNATSADKLKTARDISIQAGIGGQYGTASFDGQNNINITIPDIDATKLTGIVPIANLPQSALERLIHVPNQAARFALTTDDIQLGDSVKQDDTNVMYIVVDTNNLDNESGYQEYNAGTAAKLGTVDVGSDIQFIYLDEGIPVTSNITLGSITHPVFLNDGSLQITQYDLDLMTGASASTDGKEGLVPAPSAGEEELFLRGDGTWQVAGLVMGVKGEAEEDFRIGEVSISPSNVGAVSAENTVEIKGDILSTATQLSVDSPIEINTEIADGVVDFNTLASEIGTVAVQPDEPTDPHVFLWIKTSATG